MKKANPRTLRRKGVKGGLETCPHTTYQLSCSVGWLHASPEKCPCCKQCFFLSVRMETCGKRALSTSCAADFQYKSFRASVSPGKHRAWWCGSHLLISLCTMALFLGLHYCMGDAEPWETQHFGFCFFCIWGCLPTAV